MFACVADVGKGCCYDLADVTEKNKVKSPRFECSDSRIHTAVSGNHGNRYVGMVFLNVRYQIYAVAIRKIHVG